MEAPTEESKGIDGCLGNTACSVKLCSDLAQSDLAVHPEAKVIDCKKISDGVEFMIDWLRRIFCRRIMSLPGIRHNPCATLFHQAAAACRRTDSGQSVS